MSSLIVTTPSPELIKATAFHIIEALDKLRLIFQSSEKTALTERSITIICIFYSIYSADYDDLVKECSFTTIAEDFRTLQKIISPEKLDCRAAAYLTDKAIHLELLLKKNHILKWNTFIHWKEKSDVNKPYSAPFIDSSELSLNLHLNTLLYTIENLAELSKHLEHFREYHRVDKLFQISVKKHAAIVKKLEKTELKKSMKKRIICFQETIDLCLHKFSVSESWIFFLEKNLLDCWEQNFQDIFFRYERYLTDRGHRVLDEYLPEPLCCVKLLH